jgi:tetratricopeptide (TPR) repeat protein
MRRTLLLACAAALLPAHAFAYINAGFRSEAEYRAYLRKQEQAEIARATEAIRRDPQDPVAYFYRGRLYLEQRHEAAALADFDRALQLNPRLAGPHFLRGKVLWQRDEKARALADVEKATELNPKLVEAQVFFAAHTDDRAKAVKAAKAACEAKKYEDSTCLEILAWMYARSGDFENAVRWQKKALEMPVVWDEENARERLEKYQRREADVQQPDWYLLQ